MDDERRSYESRVGRIAGVLGVAGDDPRPGCVTIRTVAGHGDRIRAAAAAIAPAGIEVHVLEDDLVTSVPALPPPDPERLLRTASTRRAAAVPDRPVGEGAATGRSLRCDFAPCGHGPPGDDLGLRPGDPCRRKIRVPDGWMSCPGRYGVERPPRGGWAARARARLRGRRPAG